MKNCRAALLFILALFPSVVLGFIKTPQDWNIGAHLLALHIDQIQVNDQGEKNTIDPDLFFSIEGEWQLDLIHQDLSWAPQLALGIPHSGRDENINKWQYFINSFFRYSWTQDLHSHIGPGLFMSRLSSDGGKAELDNGTGSDYFYLPEKSSTSMNVTWSVGGRWEFRPQFSMGTDIIIFNLTESISRTFSASLSLHYSFGEL